MRFKNKLMLLIAIYAFGNNLFSLSAQSLNDSTLSKVIFKNEIGLNVTSLLTDLLGNNNLTEAGDYLLTYKKLNSKGSGALRMGFGIFYKTETSSVSNFDNNLTDQKFNLRIGYEWRENISKRLLYYFGVDGLVGFSQEQSNLISNTFNIRQDDTSLKIGGGPVLGFQFTIFDRMLVGIEGALYASAINQNLKFTGFNFGNPNPGGGNIVPPARSSTGFEVRTLLPKHLFLILKF